MSDKRRLYRRKTVLALLDGVAVSTLYRWMAQGKFPKPFKLANAHTIAWDADVVDAWIDAQFEAKKFHEAILDVRALRRELHEDGGVVVQNKRLTPRGEWKVTDKNPWTFVAKGSEVFGKRTTQTVKHYETREDGVLVGSDDYPAQELARVLRDYAAAEEDGDLKSYLLWAAEKLEAP